MDRIQGRVTEIIRSLEKIIDKETLRVTVLSPHFAICSFVNFYKSAKVIAQRRDKFLSPFFRHRR